MDRIKGKSLLEKLDNYTVIDLETTGVNIYKCSVIEMSAIRVRDNEVADTYSQLINPKKLLPNEIIKLTGITDNMLVGMPTIENELETFINFIGDDILLGHNLVSFDTNIIYDLCLEHLKYQFSNDMVDTCRVAKNIDVDFKNSKLSTIAGYYNIENKNEHRGLSDCMTTHLCYQKMKEKANYFKKSVKSTNYNKSKNRMQFTNETKSLQMLQGILMGITSDMILNELEVYMLKSWLDINQKLLGNYPFDAVSKAVSKALDDGKLEQHELDEMLELFISIIDPVSSFKDKELENINFKDMVYCLSGDFEIGTKELVKVFLESKKAIVKSAVTQKTNYLLVGNLGSGSWKCGKYGLKIKKALELQEKGLSIRIIDEEDFVKEIGDINSEFKYNFESGLNNLVLNYMKKNDFDISGKYTMIRIRETSKGGSVTLGAETPIKFDYYKKHIRIFVNNAVFSMIKIPEVFKSITPKVLSNNKSYLAFDFPFGLYLIASILNIVEQSINNCYNNYTESNKFGCCSRYVECSNALKCIHPDKLHAKACLYRLNLEEGLIFYGVNKND